MSLTVYHSPKKNKGYLTRIQLALIQIAVSLFPVYFYNQLICQGIIDGFSCFDLLFTQSEKN